MFSDIQKLAEKANRWLMVIISHYPSVVYWRRYYLEYLLVRSYLKVLAKILFDFNTDIKKHYPVADSLYNILAYRSLILS